LAQVRSPSRQCSRRRRTLSNRTVVYQFQVLTETLRTSPTGIAFLCEKPDLELLVAGQ
jgi:hypothetical protein